METRVANWPIELNRVITEWARRPFSWGDSDCCQFAAEIVQALTGTDHRASFPAYASKEEAEAIMGDDGLEALITGVFGEPKPAAWAHRGDLVMATLDEGPTVGVCIGVQFVSPGTRGLMANPMTLATKAWTI